LLAVLETVANPCDILQQLAEVTVRAARACLGPAGKDASAVLEFLLGPDRTAVVPCNSVKEFSKAHCAAIVLAACVRHPDLMRRVMQHLAAYIPPVSATAGGATP
jgi:hypothetical protein